MMQHKYSVVLLLAVVLGIFFGYRQVLPVSPPEDFDETPIRLHQAADAPNLQMMLSHLRIIASEPHPVDSPALRGVQEYIKGQITDMGFTWEEDVHTVTLDALRTAQEALISTSRTDEEIRAYAGMQDDAISIELHNIYTLVDAPYTDDTVVFMAHTDSVVYGPGAFDDGVAVAAMLEGLRMLEEQPPARDVLFLFTDGEEQGLLGADHFVTNHPELRERAVAVVNLEARGNNGIPVLFESSQQNLGLMRTYRYAVASPFSTSIATTVYGTMPNSTDLSIFLEAGYPGINIAVIGGGDVYHTEDDNYDTFNRSSANHYLLTVTGLTETLAHEPELNLTSQHNAIQFPFFRGNLIVIPEPVGAAVALAVFFLCVALVIWLRKTQRIQLRHAFYAMLWQIGCMLFAWGIGAGSVELLARTDVLSLLSPTLAQMLYAVLLITVLYVALLSAAIIRRKGIDRLSFAAGSLMLFGVETLVTALTIPGVSYLLTIPTIALGIPLALFFMSEGTARALAPMSIFITLMCWVPVCILLQQALMIYGAGITLALVLLPVTLLIAQIMFWLSSQLHQQYSTK